MFHMAAIVLKLMSKWAPKMSTFFNAGVLNDYVALASNDNIFATSSWHDGIIFRK